VPGNVGDLHVVSVTSRSATVSWSELDCSLRNGADRHDSYFYELRRQLAADDSRTTHGGQTTQRVVSQIVADTQVRLDGLLPFTNYTFSVHFVNADFAGPLTFVNFTTDEGGL